jgi:hypothetical protein
MTMKIITAKDGEGEQLTQQQINEDMDTLVILHEEALQQSPTWQFFGGVINMILMPIDVTE